MPGRSREVAIAGKIVTLHEKRVGELVKLFTNAQIKEVLATKIDTATAAQNGTTAATTTDQAQTPAQDHATATEATQGAAAPDLGEQLQGAVKKALGVMPTIIAPELTADDMMNAYPSEIEELVKGWIAVNFTGIQQLLEKVGGFAALYRMTVQAVLPKLVQR